MRSLGIVENAFSNFGLDFKEWSEYASDSGSDRVHRVFQDDLLHGLECTLQHAAIGEALMRKTVNDGTGIAVTITYLAAILYPAIDMSKAKSGASDEGEVVDPTTETAGAGYTASERQEAREQLATCSYSHHFVIFIFSIGCTVQKVREMQTYEDMIVSQLIHESNSIVEHVLFVIVGLSEIWRQPPLSWKQSSSIEKQFVRLLGSSRVARV
jgi:hypothetical protein